MGHAQAQHQPQDHGGMMTFRHMLWGAIIGAGTALLFAPRRGDEMREEIKHRATDARGKLNDTIDTMRDKVKQAGDTAEEGAEEALDKAKEARERGEAAMDEAAERAKRTPRT